MTGPVQFRDDSYVVVSRGEHFGLASLDLIGPPRRLYSDGATPPPLLEQWVDAARVEVLPVGAALLAYEGDDWLSRSGRALARLHAAFLLAEDPQERLVARAAATLAHQASLVAHVLQSEDLVRVLIADEVGLGKTIEAGQIIAKLLEQQPGMRVLYLSPARLVRNVHREFRDKLGLRFRKYSADDEMQGDLSSDPWIVASIHRAVHPNNRDDVLRSGPWDVIVVDECHHLTATSPGGQDGNQQYALVKRLTESLSPTGRLLLLSGTPHQGHHIRFENLLALLRRDGESPAAVSGRVIFRTKEDVRDWHGRRLFPRRDVRSATPVRLGSEYRSWYEGIGTLYDPTHGTEAQQRAATWASGQALQWAASSVQAGLGFLARLAIRRLGWGPEQASLAASLLSLRPYKGGAANESLESLFGRVRKEIERQQGPSGDEAEDGEEIERIAWRPDSAMLDELLQKGVRLLSSPAAVAKWDCLVGMLDEAPREKVVLFAQPVETVSALVNFLQERYHERPAVIVGGQTDDQRDAQVEGFRRTDGPRLLVSSRAGGEGINLQVARRLIHVDVPWNPMELEQRVGRVHRFGSTQPIIVETLVVEGTREVDAYRIAREKLAIAVGDLGNDPERFEELFARIMSLVPPQEFEEAVGRFHGSATAADEERLGQLVNDGLRRWKEFHSAYSKQQHAIRALDGGAATWEDLVSFLSEQSDVTLVANVTQPFLDEAGDEIVLAERTVPAVLLEGEVLAASDSSGMLPRSATGEVVRALGLNHPVVSILLRRAFAAAGASGAWLRSPEGQASYFDTLLPSGFRRPCGVVAHLQQTVSVHGGAPRELSLRLRIWAVNETGVQREIEDRTRPDLIRSVLRCVRVKARPATGDWLGSLQRAELETARQCAMPTDDDHRRGIRHAVWHILTCVVL